MEMADPASVAIVIFTPPLRTMLPFRLLIHIVELRRCRRDEYDQAFYCVSEMAAMIGLNVRSVQTLTLGPITH
jgi:hypothetical protein